MDFHAACRQCDRPGGPTQVGFGGARGPGKSHALLAQIALDDCQRRPELNCLLLRRVGKAMREQFEDLSRRVLHRVEYDYRRGDGVLVFPNGSRIHLGHFQDESDVDTYLGLQYDVIGVEEATTLTATKYRAIRTCARGSKEGWRPRIYTTTNPGGVGHAWYKALFVKPYQDGKETATRFIPATIEDNVMLNPEYRDTLDSLTGWLKRAWRFGDWDIAAGQFFTTFRHDQHTFPFLDPDRLPPNWTVWLAMDHGFTHYTVILLFAEDGDGQVYVLDEHAERRWLVSQHAVAVRALLARWRIAPERIDRFVAGRDCFAQQGGRHGTIAEQWKAEGFPLEAANDDRVNGAAEVLRRLGDPDAGIPPSLHISRACARLIECLPVLEHDPRRPEDVLKIDTDDDGQGGDDPYDALRYGIMAAAATSPGVDVAALLDDWRG
jgi:hypothetical protein